jgi:putative aldouronate transport system permease protein
MLNTPWAMLIPAALSVWNVIIAKTYFQTTIPDEVLEAAQLDGCSDIQFVTRIVLPLSKPIIAVISLFYAVGHWNQFFSALIYLSDQKLYPLQIVLRDILTLNELDLTMFMDGKEAAALEGMRELIKFALIVVASVPVMLIYPFVQKYFVKGIMLGSLKG